MKGTYKLSCGLEENETYGIVKTGPKQFEVYIDPSLTESGVWETPPYIKEDSTEDYIMTSSFLDNIQPPSGIDLSADADESRIMFCELYAQDYSPGLAHRFHNKELTKTLKRRGITLKRH